MVRNPTRVRASIPTASGNTDDPTILKNRILLSLPRKECVLVFTKLTLLDLQLSDVIQNPGEEIEFCYFPNTAMISIVNPMEGGKSVEVGLVGCEGFIGM
ncbi:MAG TPA: hypothetical protein VH079_07840, partial [Terriglobales bacterium]|nr:hypothetical protein [Terriglobales bacterium]